VAQQVKEDAADLQRSEDIIAILASTKLSEDQKVTVARARKCSGSCHMPFHVAGAVYGSPGRYVKVADPVKLQGYRRASTTTFRSRPST